MAVRRRHCIFIFVFPTLRLTYFEANIRLPVLVNHGGIFIDSGGSEV
jgi:hypothetical protein